MGLTINTNIDAMWLTAISTRHLCHFRSLWSVCLQVCASTMRRTTLQVSASRKTFRARSTVSSKLPLTLKTASAFFRPQTARLPKPPTLLQRVRQLAVQAANTGANDQVFT